MLHGVFPCAEEIGDSQVDDGPEHHAGVVDSRPQALDIIQTVLLRAGELPVDAGVREVREGFLV